MEQNTTQWSRVERLLWHTNTCTATHIRYGTKHNTRQHGRACRRMLRNGQSDTCALDHKTAQTSVEERFMAYHRVRSEPHVLPNQAQHSESKQHVCLHTNNCKLDQTRYATRSSTINHIEMYSVLNSLHCQSKTTNSRHCEHPPRPCPTGRA